MRKLLFLIVLTGCLGASGIAMAQTPEPVVTGPPVEQPATLGGGALRHTADSTSFGSVAVYAGLAVLGLTLAGIVRRRRAMLVAGVAALAPTHRGQGSGKHWVKPALARRRSPAVKGPQPGGAPVRSRA